MGADYIWTEVISAFLATNKLEPTCLYLVGS